MYATQLKISLTAVLMIKVSFVYNLTLKTMNPKLNNQSLYIIGVKNPSLLREHILGLSIRRDGAAVRRWWS